MKSYAELAPILKWEGIRIKPPLTIGKHISSATWKLTTPDNLWSIASQFSVSISAISVALWNRYLAGQPVMAPCFICFTNLMEVMARFNWIELAELHQCHQQNSSPSCSLPTTAQSMSQVLLFYHASGSHGPPGVSVSSGWRRFTTLGSSTTLAYWIL